MGKEADLEAILRLEGEAKLEALALLEVKEARAKERLAAAGVRTFRASPHTRLEAGAFYDSVAGDKVAERILCREDLFFLLTRGLGRKDADRDFLFDRCREVEANPDGYLDLWARDHYKSTAITFALTIQDILKDPEITVGIFSHTRDIATAFLDQIKRELERNEFLKELFPDILYAVPHKESPKWSLDGGIIVKRATNPKEATVEAWGLVDGQPTGKHFKLQVYDDVVTLKSVTNPDQIKKTTSAWELSQNLGSGSATRRRHIGTRYHINDSYREMIARGAVKPRIYAATHDGKMDGTPVLLDLKTLQDKRRDMGPYTFSCQMLQNPVADNAMGFKEEWLKFYERLGSTDAWNIYILVDPAGQKKATSDYTVIEVIGLAPDQNYYLLDAVRDRLNLTQRTAKLFELHRKWRPIATGYERYGIQSDIEHIQYVMEQENYRFSITELGGTLAKEDRILKLVPVFEQGRFWMPRHLPFFAADGARVDYVRRFIDDEFLAFPVAIHDDMLDCRARILDPALNAKFPEPESNNANPDFYSGGGTGWMAG